MCMETPWQDNFNKNNISILDSWIILPIMAISENYFFQAMRRIKNTFWLEWLHVLTGLVYPRKDADMLKCKRQKDGIQSKLNFQYKVHSTDSWWMPMTDMLRMYISVFWVSVFFFM